MVVNWFDASYYDRPVGWSELQVCATIETVFKCFFNSFVLVYCVSPAVAPEQRSDFPGNKVSTKSIGPITHTFPTSVKTWRSQVIHRDWSETFTEPASVVKMVRSTVCSVRE